MNSAATQKNLRIKSSLVGLGVGAWAYCAADAYGRKAFDSMRVAGGNLIESGLRPYQGIGHHVMGLAESRSGMGDCLKAMWHYEQAVRLCPKRYQPRVLLSLASASEFIEGDNTKYIHVCECLSRSVDLPTQVEARRALAIQDSKDGKPGRSIERLLSLYNFVKGKTDLLWLPADVANSLAYELLKAEIFEAAKDAISETKQSPYFDSNPDWQDTAEQIAAPRANLVAFTAAQTPKERAWANLRTTLKANYPRYSVADIAALTARAVG